VAHAGYMLMGILHGGVDGMAAMVFYVTAYVFMQMGAFVIVSILERSNDQYVELSDYAGLSKREPILAGLMALFMFSLAGIPPFGGFFGKYMLFKAAIDAGMTWLAIVGVVSSVISMWFYLGLIVKMYFTEPSGEQVTARPGIASVTLAVTGVVVVLLGILPAFVTNIIGTWIP
jgi:NADH-quinone oxidoreductase subunit N